MAGVFQIRWMVRSDLPQVLEIEDERFAFDWSEEDFVACLRQRSHIGKVCECDGEIVGFVIYSIANKKIELLNLAVAKKHERNGHGSALIEDLLEKVHHKSFRKAIVRIRETNMAAHLFFRSCGFLATKVERAFYEETTGEDAYLFEYKIKQEEFV